MKTVTLVIIANALIAIASISGATILFLNNQTAEGILTLTIPSIFMFMSVK